MYYTGWYGVAVQVEDYLRPEANSSERSDEPLSSIPLQFLVSVYVSSSDTCEERSQFVYPTLPEDSCIAVPKGDVFESAIVTRLSNESERQVNTRKSQITKNRVYCVCKIEVLCI